MGTSDADALKDKIADKLEEANPFVLAPLLAMDIVPRLSCFAAPFRSCSSLNGVPQCDSPPAPVPVGSPVWICQGSETTIDPRSLRHTHHKPWNQSVEKYVLVLARFCQH